MAKARDPWLAAVVMVAALGGDASGVHLRGQILRVGYPARGEDQYTLGADHYRVGAWTPILIELTNTDGDLFKGWIEVRQPDRDGDEVVARKDVVVSGTYRGHLYVPGGLYGSYQQFAVRVFDENGGLAELYDEQNERMTQIDPPRSLVPVASEARVILDISEPGVNQLGRLTADPQLQRPLMVARSSARELPDNVAGLDMVDVIVWDGADPGALDLPQWDALLEWANRGGTLVLAVSKNWLAVSKSPLAGVLPARLTGVSVMRNTQELPVAARELLFGENSPGAEFNPPLSYCQVTRGALAPGAEAVVPAEPGPEDALLVVRRSCGRGAVVLVASEMRELLKHAPQGEGFLRQVLTIRAPTRRQGDAERQSAVREADLFGDYVENLTGFQVITSLYLLFAFAFAVAYIVVATIGSWTWLKRRGLLRHAWSVFALVALVGSGVSLASVQLIRGVGHRVEEFSAVDGQAGSFDARATCYFGLKTASHTGVDLCVPGNWLEPANSPKAPAGLRPLGLDVEGFDAGSVYSATQRYEAVPLTGELRSVPMRATSKQFEAAWEGRLTGRVNASLRRLREGSSELRPDGWIQNDLGTDLDNCYLLVANRGFLERRPHRFNEIDVYTIGDLRKGAKLTINQILSTSPEDRARGRAAALEEALGPSDESKSGRGKLLSDIQKGWLNRFSIRAYGSAQEDKEIELKPETVASAMLLLTTYEEIDPDAFENPSRSLRRSQGQRLDCTDRLTREVALLVGFSHDPGPARLCWRKPGGDEEDWRAIEPSTATVMYRIAVPVAAP